MAKRKLYGKKEKTTKPRYNIRQYATLGLLGAAVASLVGGVIYLRQHQTYVEQPPKVESLEKLTTLEKFDRLSVDVQNKILSRLELYVLESTNIGKVVKDIKTKVKVTQIESPELTPLKEYYNDIQNIIYFGKRSNRDLLIIYLQMPPQLLRAHELLHRIQNANSKWEKFENLLKSRGVNPKINGPTNIQMSQKELVEFMKKYEGVPNINFEDAKNKFNALLQGYNFTHPVRQIIREVHAYLTFSPITNADDFYKKLKQIEDTREFAAQMGKEEFSKVFYKTLELIVLLDPLNAAKFVGRHGNSIDEYVVTIEQLKKEKVYAGNILQKAIERQQRIAFELGKIRRFAELYVNKAYELYKN
ncbi:hypothetical protein HYW99_02695 [Candidatus Woesearchaeota archaeon]|nr:hypothetical protein [Candidatus Woesearchaeota archaeon]